MEVEVNVELVDVDVAVDVDATYIVEHRFVFNRACYSILQALAVPGNN